MSTLPIYLTPSARMRREGYTAVTALDHGVNGTRAGLALLKLLSLTVFSDRRCPMDDVLRRP